MSLKIKNSCEVEDLIDEVTRITQRNHDEVEKAFFDTGIYPEYKKTFIMWNDKTKKDSIIVDFTLNNHPELKWLDTALVDIFKQENINDIYITLAI